ncbi:hypothetical protein TSAR_001806, partial [Trichomalopsis sarcophagae]
MSDTCKDTLGIEECWELIPTHKFIQDLKLLKVFKIISSIFTIYSRPSEARSPARVSWLGQPTTFLETETNSIMNTIETATQGHLHPSLFTHHQLQDILKTINGDMLPWDHNTVTVDMLHARTSQGKLYKIHPLPIPKEVVTNSTSYVTLIPQYSHIVVSHDMQQYLLARKDYINTCSDYQNVLICPPTLQFNLVHQNSP